jgi:hypothetical protein
LFGIARTDRVYGSEPGQGTWAPVPLVVRAIMKALIACPDCGLVLSLREHAVHPDGRVSPSVLCPRCEFCEIVRLEAYALH